MTRLTPTDGARAKAMAKKTGLGEVQDFGEIPSRSITGLKARAAVLNMIIRECQASGDERWRVHPVRQLREINRQLVTALRERREAYGEPEPEPVAVGMKSLKSGIARKRGGVLVTAKLLALKIKLAFLNRTIKALQIRPDDDGSWRDLVPEQRKTNEDLRKELRGEKDHG